MRINGAIAIAFMLTGLLGYVLLYPMWIWVGILAAGLSILVFISYRHSVSCRIKGCLSRSWMRLPVTLGNGLRLGRWRAARDRERRARLEELRNKAHQLARHCGDTYGAQSYCLELICQTEKDDPLFVEACDLYMSTVMNRSRQGRESGQRISSNTSQPTAMPARATAHIIPLPPEVDSH